MHGDCVLMINHVEMHPDDECDKIFDDVGWFFETNIEAGNFVGSCQPSRVIH